jgi:hypothetical protein
VGFRVEGLVDKPYTLNPKLVMEVHLVALNPKPSTSRGVAPRRDGLAFNDYE